MDAAELHLPPPYRRPLGAAPEVPAGSWALAGGIGEAGGPQRAAAILVKVKGFENLASPVAYLAETIGQCVPYQAILDYVGSTDELYLAVPWAALGGILGEELGRQARRKAQVCLIVFDPDQEEIVQWLH
jgi:hypothetical protein